VGLENLDSVAYSLRINDNNSLSSCTAICNYLSSAGDETIIIENNTSGCNDAGEILSLCEQYATLKIQAFYDINQNGVQDMDEEPYWGIFNLEPLNVMYNSENPIYLPPGDYTVSFPTDVNVEWLPGSFSFAIEGGECQVLVFGVYLENYVSDLQPYIGSARTRCNNDVDLDIYLWNYGTTIADGTFWLEVDPNVLGTYFIVNPPDIRSGNRYGWSFSSLYPSHFTSRRATITIPGPPDFPVGETLTFRAYAEFSDANGYQTSPTYTYTSPVRCSYDPNDKLVNPSRQGDYVLFDEDLFYTVRFQNTGNDVAYDVVIRDTLDTNLDSRTFRFLGSSHEERLRTSMDANGVLTFEFKEIFLPDSTSNFEGSQGYVSYRISTIDGLPENTPATNSAGIYFDLNPPVITNTVQSLMVSELPTVSIQSPENDLIFNIIPNPNSGIFHVQGITKGTYRVFNTMGQIIHSGRLNDDMAIDIPQAASGVYFIEIRDSRHVCMTSRLKFAYTIRLVFLKNTRRFSIYKMLKNDIYCPFLCLYCQNLI